MSGCVVVGGSGFIGTQLISHILREGAHDRVFVLDLVEPRIQDPHVHFQRCDVREPIGADVEECSVIYHLAALCKEPGFEWDDYFHVNHRGTENVCAFAVQKAIETIVYTSTMMVYRSGEAAMTESSPTCPDTAYGISKLLGEQALQIWQRGHPGRHLKIIRAGVVFGRHEDGNYTRLFRQLRRGAFVYVGRKDTVKASVYVADVVRFIDWCRRGDSPETVFNLAIPEKLTIERVCDAICEAMHLPRPFVVVPFRVAWLVACVLGFISRRRGVRFGIHQRHTEKLYYSTNIVSEKCLRAGFRFGFTLEQGIAAWKQECGGRELS